MPGAAWGPRRLYSYNVHVRAPVSRKPVFLAAFPYLDGAALLHPEAPSTVIQGRQERTVQ